ncbi:hypothetical protein R1538_05495 [Rhizobium leguminosarum]|uniref:phosphoribosyltransferase n=1 Tax=Rhizobium leguminosarum TaxID=384 RepID=UPI00293DB6E1|nr:hypothetical protein [Rhizobium leguminosarum]MDV4160573.1 hypothetical protein [Rhizobium leguminosarum]MDV4170302.1 hypothetical protein [Rhizobium leguminosarum]
MLRWTNRAGWMEFPYLSVNQGLTRTYTLAYKLTDDAAELWTSRFIRFKNKDHKTFYGGARLMYAALPPLLASMNLLAKDCVFVSALSSSETAADPNRQIPYIASQLAETMGAGLAIEAITKQPHNRIHDIYKAELRQAELDKASYVSSKLPAPNVFIFDDFVTRGDTLSRVAQAVLETNPHSKVFGVALAKTERLSYCPNPDNAHVPARWNEIWAAGEAEVK